MNKKLKGRTKPPRCTMCNKILNEWDIQEDFSWHKWIGYGSKYDLNKLDLDLCCDCFDKVLDFILQNSVNNPLREYDFKSVDGRLVAHLVEEKK
mgnify:CR=1 FL=1